MAYGGMGGAGAGGMGGMGPGGMNMFQMEMMALNFLDQNPQYQPYAQDLAQRVLAGGAGRGGGGRQEQALGLRALTNPPAATGLNLCFGGGFFMPF